MTETEKELARRIRRNLNAISGHDPDCECNSLEYTKNFYIKLHGEDSWDDATRKEESGENAAAQAKAQEFAEKFVIPFLETIVVAQEKSASRHNN